MKDFFAQLPEDLKQSAYFASGEAAWPRDQALRVIDQLSRWRVLVLGVEVWLSTVPGPTIPTPIIYTWECAQKRDHEDWVQFVERAKESAKDYVHRFQWHETDTEHRHLTPYFNLTFCDETEYRELSGC